MRSGAVRGPPRSGKRVGVTLMKNDVTRGVPPQRRREGGRESSEGNGEWDWSCGAVGSCDGCCSAEA